MNCVITHMLVKWLLLLVFIALSAASQQVQMSLKSPGTAGKPVKAIIEASGLNGMYTTRCTLHVDTAVLHSSEATIGSGISNLLVSAGFGSTTDTILITSTLLDSSRELSQGTLAVVNFPLLGLASNISSAIHIIGGSIELKTGEIVQMEINTTMVRHKNNSHTRLDRYLHKKTNVTTGKIFDLRGREICPPAKILQLYGKKYRVKLIGPSALSQQVLIFQ